MILIPIITARPDSLMPNGLAVALQQSGQYRSSVVGYTDIHETLSFSNVLPVFLWEAGWEATILDSLQTIRQTQDKVLVIAQDNIGREQLRTLVMQGKTAVVSGNISLRELQGYIRRLLEEDRRWIFSPDILTGLVDDLLVGEPGALNQKALSMKERLVVACAQRGCTIAETAEELNLSQNTVAAYRTRILKKTGAKSINELTARWNE